ncbi:MAG: hypothetical protein AABN95_27205 [Acidobacteriota bacterium]
MKTQIKVALIFVGGLLVGALSTFIIMGQLNYLTYQDFYMMSAREQTHIAWELRTNRQSELQKRAEANLPGIVLAIHNDRRLRSADEAQLVLRGIKDYYEMNSLSTPSEISVILSEVPRRKP